MMDQDGIMTVVNRAAAQLFGYTEHEMMDSNVAMLMPQSMAAMHASYVRTGVLSQVTQSGASDSKKIREVLALTKERHGLSINIAVTKHVHGKRAQFMAVVAPRPPPTHWDGAPQMTLWVSTSGSIIAASKALCHSLGYSSTEVMNLHASSIMDGDGLDMLLSSLGRAEESTGMRAYEVEVFPKGENEVVTYLAEAFMSGEKAPVVAIFFKVIAVGLSQDGSLSLFARLGQGYWQLGSHSPIPRRLAFLA